MIANMGTHSADIKLISDEISRNSWTQATRSFQSDLLRKLGEEARLHEAAGRLNLASTGHNESKTLSSIRGDSTLWLDDIRCGDASKKFLQALDILRRDLSQSMMLGLETVEAHFAVYPAGAAYARHKDCFRDDDARVLSLVCYLNIDWPDDAGGALRLHLPDGSKDIAPMSGTTVIFLSNEIEHEVLPAKQTRYSIAAWFRRHENQRY